MSKEQAYNRFPGAVVTFRALWGILVVATQKKAENRRFSLHDWEGKPIAIHISQHIGKKYEVIQQLRHPKVRRAMSQIPKFQNLNPEDQFQLLKQFCGKIIGLCWASSTPTLGETYPFKDFPDEYPQVFYITETEIFDEDQFIDGHKGNTIITQIQNDQVMDRFLAAIPV